jgi:hypothetical protein
MPVRMAIYSQTIFYRLLLVRIEPPEPPGRFPVPTCMKGAAALVVWPASQTGYVSSVQPMTANQHTQMGHEIGQAQSPTSPMPGASTSAPQVAAVGTVLAAGVSMAAARKPRRARPFKTVAVARKALDQKRT